MRVFKGVEVREDILNPQRAQCVDGRRGMAIWGIGWSLGLKIRKEHLRFRSLPGIFSVAVTEPCASV